MLLRSLVFTVRILAICVILSCSSARALNCPGKIFPACSCGPAVAVSAYTALLFTVQFVVEFWNITVINNKIDQEQQQIMKLAEVSKQLMAMDEIRSVKADSASFLTMLEKLKKQYEQGGKANKARKVNNILHKYRVAPSYYVFTHSLSPFSYEHCLKNVVNDPACRMIPVGREPLKLISLSGLTVFFDQLLLYFDQHNEILDSMQVTFNQLFQIGVSYCGSYLNTDSITMFHPCMKMVTIHIQNYPVVNDDWGRVVKAIETNSTDPDAISLKLISLNEGNEPPVGQYRLNGFTIEPAEN